MRDPGCLVEVWAPGASSGMVGSGYLLRDGLVLTARHVVDGTAGRDCEVRTLGRERWLAAKVAWRGEGDCDVALLRIKDAASLPRATLAVLGRVVGTDPVEVQAVGFAAAQERPDGTRDTEDLRGWIMPLSAHKSGHLTVSIDGSVPEITNGGSPWEGMSGAALFSNGLLVGVVIVAPEHFGTDRLEAIPLTAISRDPEFEAAVNGRSGKPIVLGAVEAVGLLDSAYGAATLAHPTTVDERDASAAMLLDPDFAVVPFRGRASELDELEQWCTNGPQLRVMLRWGAGGIGKSRLAGELCYQRGAEGAVAGFLAKDVEVDRLSPLAGRVELLVVVDEAHTRHAEVVLLLKVMANSAGGATIRVLLLARGDGDWWRTQLPLSLADDAHATSALEQASVRELRPVEETKEGRAEAFLDAAKAFAERLNVERREKLRVPDFSEPAFDSILWVHLAALSAVDGETGLLDAPIVRSELIDYALRRERRYWNNTSRSCGLDLELVVLERAVAVASITGASDEEQATNILRVIPDLAAAPQNASAVARWLHELYPPVSRRLSANQSSTWLPALTPEPLGEALIARVISDLNKLPTRLLEHATKEQVDTALRALTQAARSHNDLRISVQQAIDDHLPHIWRAAITVAQGVGDPIGPMLASALIRYPRPDLANEIAAELPAETVTLRDLAVIAGEQIVEYVRGLDTTPERDAILATSLNNLSNRLSGLGRREDGLAAIEEAVEIRRGLATAHPDAFLSDLAMSLNNLSGSLSDVGRHEDGLAAIEEAVEVYRGLATAHPDAFLPDLAMSLNNLSNRLGGVGRREDALAAIEEAVEIRRGLATAHPDAFLPNLAMSLNNLSGRLSDVGRHEDGLAAIEEAVEIRRGLATARPDAFLPNLAMSLNNLSGSLSDVGRHEDGLAAIEEALHLVLPALERAAYFLPDAGHRLMITYRNRCSEASRDPDSDTLQRLEVVLQRAGLVTESS